jgi:hypothetical protein
MQESLVVIRSDASLLSVVSQRHIPPHLGSVAVFTHGFLHPHDEAMEGFPV